MQPLIYTPAMQGIGAFDEGKLQEQRPIGFPGDGSVVKRLGPLFYWAWGTANARAHIGLHPHQGFEIMTYVIAGYGEHGDTLGTRSKLEAGGVQLMQTGSGVSHEETISEGGEMFQIWFEPHLAKAITNEPTYQHFDDNVFPVQTSEGYRIKKVIGEGSPVQLTADVLMWDVEVNKGQRYAQRVQVGRTLAALVIRGDGRWVDEELNRQDNFRHRDFIVARASRDETAIFESVDEDVRLLIIEVPDKPGYPLLRKG